ncbi:hypothetical protein Taro_005954 [Colocasia esculenta]|uniref:RecA family profile 2 domain-containing protein n=1 Tax=Colocasia esculenta TaxID=4460 RepID=A0A843TUL9_COLES|nr:hypothetical protein [Colocasia esculenta]
MAIHRSKVSTFGGGFGGPTEVTSGGNALKFYASVRLNIRRIGLVKKGEEVGGQETLLHSFIRKQMIKFFSFVLQIFSQMYSRAFQVLVKIVKNKHAPPFKTAQFELEFGKGISRDSEIIELGCKHKFIAKAGGAFYNMNGQSFRGKDAIKRYFTQNEGAREELMVKLREKLMLPGRRLDEETETTDPELLQEVVTSDATDEDIVAAVEA